MKNTTLSFRPRITKKLFPSTYTKMRFEDFINKAEQNKKILSKTEYEKLVNIPGEMEKMRMHDNWEFYAKRNKRGVELIPFD